MLSIDNSVGSDGKKGAGNVVIEKIVLKSNYLVAQNVPELLMNYFFPLSDLAASLGRFLQRKANQQQLVIASTLMKAMNLYLDSRFRFFDEGETENFLENKLLFQKAKLSRKAWFVQFVLRRFFQRSEIDPARFATELLKAELIQSPVQFWNILNDKMKFKDENENVFGQVMKNKGIATLFGVGSTAAKREDAEVDVLVKVGPIVIHPEHLFEYTEDQGKRSLLFY